MASRTRGRQFAVQMIYQQMFSKQDPDQVFQTFWKNHEADKETRMFSEDLVQGVLDHRQELDLEISAYLKNWTIDRIAILDRIVLEVGFYELLFERDVPWKVVVDEAVGLAAAFGSDKSPRFINGVLHSWTLNNGMQKGNPGAAPEEIPDPE